MWLATWRSKVWLLQAFSRIHMYFSWKETNYVVWFVISIYVDTHIIKDETQYFTNLNFRLFLGSINQNNTFLVCNIICANFLYIKSLYLLAIIAHIFTTIQVTHGHSIKFYVAKIANCLFLWIACLTLLYYYKTREISSW